MANILYTERGKFKIILQSHQELTSEVKNNILVNVVDFLNDPRVPILVMPPEIDLTILHIEEPYDNEIGGGGDGGEPVQDPNENVVNLKKGNGNVH